MNRRRALVRSGARNSEIAPAMPSVLFVDDDELFADAAADILRARGYVVETASSVRDALARDPSNFDCVVVDHQLPDGTGLALASQIDSSRTRVVLVSANPRLDAAVEALRIGVVDFLSKPVDFESLVGVLRSIETTKAPAPAIGSNADLLPSFEEQRAFILALARSRAPVLITGETGTGKGHLARALHALGGSPRPLVAINCAAVPESLAEAELFGVERGAFTGAERREGLLELAHEGTLMLDEVGDLAPTMQAKLLTFLDDGLVRRVGGRDVRRVSVRIVAATNKDLHAESRAGRFRSDLLHRLDVAAIELRPLRERPADIAALAVSYVERIAERDGRPWRLAEGELELLSRLEWPGNIRELHNAIERSALVATDEDLVPSHFVRRTERTIAAPSSSSPELAPADGDLSLAAVERAHVLRVMRQCNGNRAMAASILGIGVSTLRRKLAELGQKDPGTP